MPKKLNTAAGCSTHLSLCRAFLSQVLDSDKTCHNAVSRVVAWLAAEDAQIPSVDTSAYCQARKRLPEKLLQRLFSQIAKNLEQKTTEKHLWCGRHVSWWLMVQLFQCLTRQKIKQFILNLQIRLQVVVFPLLKSALYSVSLQVQPWL